MFWYVLWATTVVAILDLGLQTAREGGRMFGFYDRFRWYAVIGVAVFVPLCLWTVMHWHVLRGSNVVQFNGDAGSRSAWSSWVHIWPTLLTMAWQQTVAAAVGLVGSLVISSPWSAQAFFSVLFANGLMNLVLLFQFSPRA